MMDFVFLLPREPHQVYHTSSMRSARVYVARPGRGEITGRNSLIDDALGFRCSRLFVLSIWVMVLAHRDDVCHTEIPDQAVSKAIFSRSQGFLQAVCLLGEVPF
jgi:hypothetical protein